MQNAEHSAILSTFIKLPIVIKIFVLSILSGRFTHDLLYVYFDYCLNMLFGAEKKLLPDTIFRYAPKIYVGENSFFGGYFFFMYTSL